jgi:hypothetical protein
MELLKTFSPAIVGVVGMVFTYRISKKALDSSIKDGERKDIHEKLNKFYGPFQQLLNKNNKLYELFNPEGKFRTLTELLNGRKFKGNSGKLLKEIVEIDRQLEKLILDHGGLIDDEEMLEILVEAATHFNLLIKAYEKTIEGETGKFKKYVYPRKLGEKIDEQIKKMKKRLEVLNKA